jgi:hypothetical protein
VECAGLEIQIRIVWTELDEFGQDWSCDLQYNFSTIIRFGHNWTLFALISSGGLLFWVTQVRFIATEWSRPKE